MLSIGGVERETDAACAVEWKPTARCQLVTDCIADRHPVKIWTHPALACRSCSLNSAKHFLASCPIMSTLRETSELGSVRKRLNNRLHNSCCTPLETTSQEEWVPLNTDPKRRPLILQVTRSCRSPGSGTSGGSSAAAACASMRGRSREGWPGGFLEQAQTRR